MLIIARKLDERITIGDDVVITIVGIGENTVRIGIEAPRKLAVHRLESKPPAEAKGCDNVICPHCKRHLPELPHGEPCPTLPLGSGPGTTDGSEVVVEPVFRYDVHTT